MQPRTLLVLSVLCVLVSFSCAQIFLDVGSSGTKIFVTNDEGVSVPLGSMGATYKEGPVLHLGLAAAAVADLKHKQIKLKKLWLPKTPPNTGWNSDADHTVEQFFEQIWEKASSGGAADGSSVVALATAGNRAPDVPDVMAAFCGGDPAPTHGFRINRAWCRLTPGTEEAWFEWIAVQTSKSKIGENGPSRHATGGVRSIFSMGGASAQVAVPLDRETLAAWNTLITKISEHQEDYFVDNTLPRREDYWRNFIGVKMANARDLGFKWSALGGTTFPGSKYKTKDGRTVTKRPRPVVAVGLVSFLGLGRAAYGLTGNTRHIAGGNNAMKTVMTEVLGDCHNWGECFQAAQDRLMEDPFFREIITFLRAKKLTQARWALLSNMNVLRSIHNATGTAIPEAGFCASAVTNRGRGNKASRASKVGKAKCVGIRTRNPTCERESLQNGCQRVKQAGRQACKWLRSDAAAVGIARMSRTQLSQCTETEMMARVRDLCGTPERMRANDEECISQLSRVAIARLMFGQNLRGADLILSTGALGDPKDGAEWIIKQNTRRGAGNDVYVCSPKAASYKVQCARLGEEDCETQSSICQWKKVRVSRRPKVGGTRRPAKKGTNEAKRTAGEAKRNERARRRENNNDESLSGTFME